MPSRISSNTFKNISKNVSSIQNFVLAATQEIIIILNLQYGHLVKSMKENINTRFILSAIHQCKTLKVFFSSNAINIQLDSLCKLNLFYPFTIKVSRSTRIDPLIQLDSINFLFHSIQFECLKILHRNKK